MGIAQELTKLDEKDNETLGKAIIALFISNIHKASDEVYDFIASYKKISVEEAKEYNVMDLLKELTKVEGIKDFLV